MITLHNDVQVNNNKPRMRSDAQLAVGEFFVVLIFLQKMFYGEFRGGIFLGEGCPHPRAGLQLVSTCRGYDMRHPG